MYLYEQHNFARCPKSLSFLWYYRFLLLFLVSNLLTVHEVSARIVYDRMYLQLDAVNACILRLNGTHSFGCTSSRSGNVGVVHVINNNTDLQWILKESKMDAYVVAIFSDMFNFNNLRALNDSERVNGVFVMQSPSRSPLENFSPEDTCPNRYSGLANPTSKRETCNEKKPWNPFGNMMSMYKWKMPVFFTSDNETINLVKNCYQMHNLPLETQLERPLCALQLSSHMFAAVDSRTCLRRNNSPYNINPIRYCDPLGDQNIILPLIPLDKPHEKYIIVSARLDSTSFFHNLASGSLSTATSLVALLMTSQILTDMIRKSDVHPRTNVLFVLFNGEAYDYIGSSRAAWDMKNGRFPLKENPIRIEDVELFVELSQLTWNTGLWYHHLPPTKTKTDDPLRTFISTFNQTAETYKFTKPEELVDTMLPPSSLQNFVALEPSLPGLVFASYQKQFKNHFYHSLYDNATNPDVDFIYANGTRPAGNDLQAFIAKFSLVLAQTLFKQITVGSKPSELQPNYTLADELLYCYLVSSDCKIFAETGYNKLALKSSLDYYVSVFGLQQNRVTTLTILAMVDLTGTRTNATERDDCKGQKVWWNAEKRICLETEINVTEARSPAFVEPGYDLASGVYSSWTESSWGQEMEVRMFVKPSAGYEWLVFCIGNSIMLLSLTTVFWIKRNAPELFNYPQLIAAANI